MSKQADFKLPYRRIVIKLGTSLLTGGSNHLDTGVMAGLVEQVARLHRQGAEVVIVSSGAIASGRYKLGLAKKIRGIPYKQVLASVGQSRLMSAYERLFEPYNVTVAQALLTRLEISERAGYLNARNTLLALIELGVISVINENDVVAIDEIKGARFGDNDNLSAMVCNLIDADLLIILTDIAGLYTADPHRDPAARLIRQVERIDAEIQGLAAGAVNGLGTGGMYTKVEAARLATASGVRVVIADGRGQDIIPRLVAGEELGTHFLPGVSKLDSRRRWMLCGLSTKGRVTVDAGAALAVTQQHRSLLAAGIRRVEEEFERGDIIDIYDPEGVHIACGITNYSSADIERIMGKQSGKIADVLGYDYGPEVVHRNNLTVLNNG
ncbi:MAG: glutamate 5-kinase [Chloroflexi bacterium]|nr:glutamate 5-kinase [Chloroflexota bacterium]